MRLRLSVWVQGAWPGHNTLPLASHPSRGCRTTLRGPLGAHHDRGPQWLPKCTQRWSLPTTKIPHSFQIRTSGEVITRDLFFASLPSRHSLFLCLSLSLSVSPPPCVDLCPASSYMSVFPSDVYRLARTHAHPCARKHMQRQTSMHRGQDSHNLDVW
jgi:hypothetical protein